MTNKLQGTGVALVTPFHSSGNVDFTALTKLVNHVVEGGVDFVVALGTTAEAATLTADEKAAVVDCIYDTVNKRAGFVIGAGGNNTRTVLDSIRHLDAQKIDGILSVVPYYNKPNQKGMYAHFKEIALHTEIPIILYNVPGRTASNMNADTIISLAEDFENIVAVKEASGDMNQIMKIIKRRPEGFLVLSGDDNLTLPMMSVGGDGVISVIANAYPKSMSQMVNLMLNADDRFAALRLHYQMMDMIEALFADGNPAGVKALLEMMDILKNNLRLPLVKANRSLVNHIRSLHEQLNLS